VDVKRMMKEAENLQQYSIKKRVECSELTDTLGTTFRLPFEKHSAIEWYSSETSFSMKFRVF
jgi:hypothetical protein